LAVEDYNEGKNVTLTMDFNIFGNQKKCKDMVNKIFQKYQSQS